jgi:hypothetical protein
MKQLLKLFKTLHLLLLSLFPYLHHLLFIDAADPRAVLSLIRVELLKVESRWVHQVEVVHVIQVFSEEIVYHVQCLLTLLADLLTLLIIFLLF